MRKTSVTLTCESCGKTFESKLSHAKGRHTCSLVCKGALARRTRQAEIEAKFGKPIFDLLTEMYFAKNMGTKPIAKALGVSDRVMWDWFDSLGIPRRTKQEGVRLQWVNADDRKENQSRQAKAWAKTHPDETLKQSLRANRNSQLAHPSTLETRLQVAFDQAGIKYEFQHIIGDQFLVDFAIFGANVVVECDGSYWHATPTQKARDLKKDAYLQACGYTVLRFSDKQLDANIDSCVNSVRALLTH